MPLLAYFRSFQTSLQLLNVKMIRLPMWHLALEFEIATS